MKRDKNWSVMWGMVISCIYIYDLYMHICAYWLRNSIPQRVPAPLRRQDKMWIVGMNGCRRCYKSREDSTCLGFRFCGLLGATWVPGIWYVDVMFPSKYHWWCQNIAGLRTPAMPACLNSCIKRNTANIMCCTLRRSPDTVSSAVLDVFSLN